MEPADDPEGNTAIIAVCGVDVERHPNGTP